MGFVVGVGTELVVPERGILDQDFGKGLTLGGIEVFTVGFNPIIDINCFLLCPIKDYFDPSEFRSQADLQVKEQSA